MTLEHLNKKDRAILAAAEISFPSVVKVARMLKLPAHVVHYSFAKLQELKILGDRRIWIDAQVLGYSFVNLHVRLKGSSSRVRSAILNAAQKHEQCTWLFETDGQYQYVCSLTIKEIKQLMSFYKSVFSKNSIVVARKTIQIQQDFEFFGRKYLLSGRRLPSIFLPVRNKIIELEPQDHCILSTYEMVGTHIVKRVPEVIGMSLATLSRRLEQLEKKSIIKGYSYWIDGSMLGRQLYVLRISVSELSANLKYKIWQFASNHPLVIYILETLGEWDFELGVDVQAVHELQQTIDMLSSIEQDSLLDISPVAVTRFHKYASFPAPSTNVK